MLENESQTSFLTLGTDGVLKIGTIKDANLVGTHSVKFKAYLKDIDPEAKFPKPIDLTLNI